MPKIVDINKQKIVDDSKIVLEAWNEFPADCPKPTCLTLASIDFGESGRAVITLDAQPPQLPTKEEHRAYEIHEVCRRRCGIQGNNNRQFFVTEDAKGDTVAKSDWRVSH